MDNEHELGMKNIQPDPTFLVWTWLKIVHLGCCSMPINNLGIKFKKLPAQISGNQEYKTNRKMQWKCCSRNSHIHPLQLATLPPSADEPATARPLFLVGPWPTKGIRFGSHLEVHVATLCHLGPAPKEENGGDTHGVFETMEFQSPNQKNYKNPGWSNWNW